MKVLVVGVGVIGSYLTHAVCEAGNEVTVVARGTWAQTLREKGLVIHHYVQHTTTTDRPRVVEAIPTGERFDVAFSVMRQNQQLAALPELATIDARVLVLVGNNMRAPEMARHLTSNGRAQHILFGFQSTAGNRETDHVDVVRWGATGLDVAPLHGEATPEEKVLLARVFTKAYKPHWTHDFDDWLKYHAAAVIPMCYVSYICGCDLHRASNQLLHRMVAAQGEAYALLSRLGYQVLPESDRGLFDGGLPTAAWFGFCWLLAHTEIGTLCVDDHCKHAPDEMNALDNELWKLRAQAQNPDFPMPNLDGLYNEMGGWNHVHDTWR